MFCAWWNVVDVIEEFVVFFLKGVERFHMQRMEETFESSSNLIMLKYILKDSMHENHSFAFKLDESGWTTRIARNELIQKWMFPEIVVPPNHQFW